MCISFFFPHETLVFSGTQAFFYKLSFHRVHLTNGEMIPMGIVNDMTADLVLGLVPC